MCEGGHGMVKRVRVEIYEGDPFTGCCGPGISSAVAIEKLRKMLTEREETVKTLMKEFHGEVEIERKIVSSRKPYSSYPEHVRKVLSQSIPLPFIFINGRVVSEGAFPSFEDFRQLISRHLKNPLQQNPEK